MDPADGDRSQEGRHVAVGVSLCAGGMAVFFDGKDGDEADTGAGIPVGVGEIAAPSWTAEEGGDEKASDREAEVDEDLAMIMASSSTKVYKFGIRSFGMDGGRSLTVGMDDGVEDTAGAGWTLLPVIPDDFEGEAIVVEARSATSDTCKGDEDLSSNTGRMVDGEELRRRFADDAARWGGSPAVNASTSSSVWGGMVEAAICLPFS